MGTENLKTEELFKHKESGFTHDDATAIELKSVTDDIAENHNYAVANEEKLNLATQNNDICEAFAIAKPILERLKNAWWTGKKIDKFLQAVIDFGDLACPNGKPAFSFGEQQQ